MTRLNQRYHPMWHNLLVNWSLRKPGESHSTKKNQSMKHWSLSACLNKCVQVCFTKDMQDSIWEKHIFWSLGLWWQPPLSLWYTDHNHNNTSSNSASWRTQDEVSKSQGRERSQQHFINRKWLHYGLKDRREWSLVTALIQIHTFLQGLGRARSPLWTLLPSHYLGPGALLRVQLGRWRDLGVLEEGLGVCRYLGWPDNQETLDSPCLVTLHTCGERMHFVGWSESSHLP